MVEKPRFDITMDKFSIQNITKIDVLQNELELERASNLFLKLRVLAKGNDAYVPVRKHLASLIKHYEDSNWTNLNSLTDDRITQSDSAERVIAAENKFYSHRKQLIRAKLKDACLNQSDLAKILGHRKGYMSELINGIRPFSKDDIVIINRLFHIKLEDLVPTFIKEEKALHIKNTLQAIPKTELRLSK